MITQTEFDKELNHIEREFAKKCRNAVFMPDLGRVLAFEDVHKWHNKAIKQAVDKYVIGKSETLSNKQVKAGRIYILGDPQGDAQDRLRDKQRLALWGDK